MEPRSAESTPKSNDLKRKLSNDSFEENKVRRLRDKRGRFTVIKRMCIFCRDKKWVYNAPPGIGAKSAIHWRWRASFPRSGDFPQCNHSPEVCKKCLRGHLSALLYSGNFDQLYCTTCKKPLRINQIKKYASKKAAKWYLTLQARTFYFEVC